MKRYAALWRDTWWVWLSLFAFGIVLGTLLEWVFFLAIPTSLFAFVYFGLMRYDSDGNSTPDRFSKS